MGNFINTIATIGGVLFFLLAMLVLGAVVYITLTDMWNDRDEVEDPNYDWKDME